MAERICYVYGVATPALDLSGAPPGIDGAKLTLERAGALAALVSTVDPGEYGEDRLDERTADLEWLAPRAQAHDAVLTWASDHVPVAPFPMLSLFRGAEGVRAMLESRASELSRALARAASGREYQLRVFRLDERLAQRLATMSPRIAELEASAAAASPGQRYLLERKMVEERKSETRRVGAEVAREVHGALRSHAEAVAVDPLPRQGGGDREGAGAAVLNAAYLVADDSLGEFREVLTALVERLEPSGFRFEFTGPWPVYHFVRGNDDGG